MPLYTNETATTTDPYHWFTYNPVIDTVVDTKTSYGRTFVTNKDLEDLAKRIYEIIKWHTTIDISENEFMSLLEEGKNNE